MSVASLDARAINALQVGYDFLLDRYGVLIGTFRAGAISACFAAVFLKQYFSAEQPLARLVVIAMWAAIFLPLVGITLVRPHLSKDNTLQQARRFVPLNGAAMLHQEADGLYVRLSTFILVCIIHWLGGPSVDDAISTAFLMIWLWSRAVMVRDRDEARFRQKTHQLARA